MEMNGAGVSASDLQLLQKRCFHSLLRCYGERRVRNFADLFRKLTRDVTHIFELLHVTLAERTHEEMNAQLHPGEERQFFIHA